MAVFGYMYVNLVYAVYKCMGLVPSNSFAPILCNNTVYLFLASSCDVQIQST